MKKAAILLALILASTAVYGQSRAESFTTKWDRDLGGIYTHTAAWEFDVPNSVGDSTLHSIRGAEVEVDIYWNTSNVFLLDAHLLCDTWTSGYSTFAVTSSLSQFGRMRSWTPQAGSAYTGECVVNLLFFSVDDNVRAAYRINVTSGGGFKRLRRVASPLSAAPHDADSMQEKMRAMMQELPRERPE